MTIDGINYLWDPVPSPEPELRQCCPPHQLPQESEMHQVVYHKIGGGEQDNHHHPFERHTNPRTQ